MTYARARLWVGISSVGTWVVLSLFVLFRIKSLSLEFPYLSLPSSILVFLGLYTLVSLPFDIVGGYLLPLKYGRSKQNFINFMLGYLRGIFVYGSLIFVFAYILLSIRTSVSSSYLLFVLLFFVLTAQIVLAFCQRPIARLVAKFSPVKQGDQERGFEVWEGSDVGFTGGLSFFQKGSIIPKQWLESFSKEELSYLLKRREFLVKNHSYLVGIWGAIVFNTIGLFFGYLGCVVTGISLEADGYLSYVLVWSSSVTLWGFLGLLVLPSLSQKATLVGDSIWSKENKGSVATLIAKLDAYQDKEPNRKPQIQKIFHPIASVAIRLEHLGKIENNIAAWHIARYTLFLSLSVLSLLGRAVHCNVGRPELWVFLPSDG